MANCTNVPINIYGNIGAVYLLRQAAPDIYLEDFPCKEEKVEDFVFKLKEVLETSLTMTLTAYPVGHTFYLI